MSNKINIRQESSEYHLTSKGEWVKHIAKRALQATGVGLAGAVVIAGGAQVVDALNSPDFSGSKTVTVHEGETLDGIINEQVEGGASYTGTVRAEVKQDPDNADVFEDGILRAGEKVEMPEKVTD